MRTAYEVCPVCSGYALHINSFNGEVDDGCDECNSTGMVRIRDDKGRFTTREFPSGEASPSPSPDEASAPAKSKAAGSLSAAADLKEAGAHNGDEAAPASIDFMLTGGLAL
jgi:hypothetical protein